jgi:hypothetical protein
MSEQATQPEANTDIQETPRLRWELPVWVVVNSLLASIPVFIAGEPGLFLYTILPALLLTVILLMVPGKEAGRIGLVLGLVLIATAALSVVTAEIPAAAVIAMSAVVYLTSLPTSRAVSGLGNLVALAYLVYAWLGPPALEASGVDTLTVVGMTTMATAITYAVMMITPWILGKLGPKRAEEIEEARESSGVDPDDRPSLGEFLGPANPMFRYAVVRALVFGTILAVTFSMRGDRSGFWVLLAMIIVSQPTGRAAWQSAIQRTLATLAGVVVFLIAFALLPEGPMLALSAAILLVGLMWIERSNTVVVASATVFVIALSGVAQSDYLTWAVSRLIDTVVGAGIGVLVSMAGESRPRADQTHAADPDST